MGKDKYKETQQKLEAAGKKARRLGWILTLLITVPIILYLVLGVIGAIIGGVIILLVLIGISGGKPKEAAGGD